VFSLTVYAMFCIYHVVMIIAHFVVNKVAS